MRRMLLVLVLVSLAGGAAGAQSGGGEVVDRMVAVINGRELITYTDLLWQLALQPDVPLDAPRREDLRRALDLLIDQRLIAQEAEKLPSVAPTADEISGELARLIGFFPSQADFYNRLGRVGLGQDSAQLREIVEDRVRIRKYLDFRFRSFTVVTQREVEDYYRDVYVPRRRRQSPGLIVPRVEEVYKEIEGELIESKIDSDTDEFLEESRTAAEITILDKSFEGGR
ncbi:MAG: SurA N-terminal domain-containing protein [Acidobacteriota bacterium]|nr:SurA N-terminal domain-containing protein [Acidobacteriota bacterium]